MLSSMTPTILAKDGQLFMVTGSPGGRTIINTVLETIVDVVDFGMNAQEAVDAPRFHHQWLPDRLDFEKYGLSADTVEELERRGHTLRAGGGQGVAQVIVYNAKEDMLEGGTDRRASGRRRGRRARADDCHRRRRAAETRDVRRACVMRAPSAHACRAAR